MAKASEAQIKAVEKYRKTNIRQVLVKVNKKTMPNIYEHICGLDNIQGYILDLIRDDMRAKGLETDD